MIRGHPSYLNGFVAEYSIEERFRLLFCFRFCFRFKSVADSFVEFVHESSTVARPKLKSEMNFR